MKVIAGVQVKHVSRGHILGPFFTPKPQNGSICRFSSILFKKFPRQLHGDDKPIESKLIWYISWRLMGWLSLFESHMKAPCPQMLNSFHIGAPGGLKMANGVQILSKIWYLSVNTGMIFTIIIYKGHMKALKYQMGTGLIYWLFCSFNYLIKVVAELVSPSGILFQVLIVINVYIWLVGYSLCFTFCMWQHSISANINSLRAKFCRGNINIYLRFMSLLHIDMTQVPKILSQVRPWPTYST